MSTAIVTAPEFGNLLKDWRTHRRMSQLSLSALSGISQRHISFLETGRSKPSRGMVLALSESLDVPLRERNTLLQSAGFSALYSEESLTESANEVFRETLQATLDKQEPYPALVLDGRWNLIMANNGALNLFSRFLDIAGALGELGAEDFQMVRLCLHDAGFKPYIVNWEELTYSFLQRLRRALLVNPRDARLPPLIEEIVAHPDAPKAWREPEWGRPPAPAINLELMKDDERYVLFTMLAHFGSPQHVTLEELSVELFYPADAETRERLEALGRTP